MQLFLGRGGDCQEPGHHPLFDLLWSASELSWYLWFVIPLADVVTMNCTEAQSLAEVDSSTILDLAGSNQFMSYSTATSFF